MTIVLTRRASRRRIDDEGVLGAAALMLYYSEVRESILTPEQAKGMEHLQGLGLVKKEGATSGVWRLAAPQWKLRFWAEQQASRLGYNLDAYKANQIYS